MTILQFNITAQSCFFVPGDNLMSMLLKPSFTVQEANEVTMSLTFEIDLISYQVANMDDEESSNGGDNDQVSPSRKGSQGEFRFPSSYYCKS